MLVPSACDAAFILAIEFAKLTNTSTIGHEEFFIAEMFKLAQHYEMFNTVIINCYGFNGCVSTINDLRKMMKIIKEN